MAKFGQYFAFLFIFELNEKIPLTCSNKILMAKISHFFMQKNNLGRKRGIFGV